MRMANSTYVNNTLIPALGTKLTGDWLNSYGRVMAYNQYPLVAHAFDAGKNRTKGGENFTTPTGLFVSGDVGALFTVVLQLKLRGFTNMSDLFRVLSLPLYKDSVSLLEDSNGFYLRCIHELTARPLSGAMLPPDRYSTRALLTLYKQVGFLPFIFLYQHVFTSQLIEFAETMDSGMGGEQTLERKVELWVRYVRAVALSLGIKVRYATNTLIVKFIGALPDYLASMQNLGWSLFWGSLLWGYHLGQGMFAEHVYAPIYIYLWFRSDAFAWLVRVSAAVDETLFFIDLGIIEVCRMIKHKLGLEGRGFKLVTYKSAGLPVMIPGKTKSQMRHSLVFFFGMRREKSFFNLGDKTSIPLLLSLSAFGRWVV